MNEQNEQNEQKINELTKQRDELVEALTNLWREVNCHCGGASLMHPRLTRSISAASEILRALKGGIRALEGGSK
jgi:hypothetical protein